ncbi:uncharacterized protein C8Q71DRAFT_282025 [Rhodofomes roseus]|uniref:Uncharacterized protein n=1 Tax=Rhodofomes roseus TaxID=34475 RepID=A0ABQ8K5Z2_9APHY|nr:uncharacterized protein C8Q71DRAFT_282025 [Rhodofomes roseus]KAH9832114.1 hypothetical protein C8Q71DRAFT_282025 [Rhodofomes roseus]
MSSSGSGSDSSHDARRSGAHTATHRTLIGSRARRSPASQQRRDRPRRGHRRRPLHRLRLPLHVPVPAAPRRPHPPPLRRLRLRLLRLPPPLPRPHLRLVPPQPQLHPRHRNPPPPPLVQGKHPRRRPPRRLRRRPCPRHRLPPRLHDPLPPRQRPPRQRRPRRPPLPPAPPRAPRQPRLLLPRLRPLPLLRQQVPRRLPRQLPPRLHPLRLRPRRRQAPRPRRRRLPLRPRLRRVHRLLALPQLARRPQHRHARHRHPLPPRPLHLLPHHFLLPQRRPRPHRHRHPHQLHRPIRSLFSVRPSFPPLLCQSDAASPGPTHGDTRCPSPKTRPSTPRPGTSPPLLLCAHRSRSMARACAADERENVIIPGARPSLHLTVPCDAMRSVFRTVPSLSPTRRTRPSAPAPTPSSSLVPSPSVGGPYCVIRCHGASFASTSPTSRTRARLVPAAVRVRLPAWYRRRSASGAACSVPCS